MLMRADLHPRENPRVGAGGVGQNKSPHRKRWGE